MCDYSLEMYQSRPARAGERYESQRFASGSIGFVSPADTITAVCMADGTKLRLENINERLQAEIKVSGTETATFVRLDAGPHHDGIRFENGVAITLQRLGSGVAAYLVPSDVTLAPAPFGVREKVPELAD